MFGGDEMYVSRYGDEETNLVDEHGTQRSNDAYARLKKKQMHLKLDALHKIPSSHDHRDGIPEYFLDKRLPTQARHLPDSQSPNHHHG